MHHFIGLISLLLAICQVEAATFNVAFAAGVEARVESLLNEPWTRILDPLAAAYNSRWSYVYDGEDVTTGLRDHELINYVHDNETLAVFWLLSKPTDLSGLPGFDFIYLGFENGKHFGYKLLDEVILFYMASGNASCPEHGIDMRCRYTYSNSTSQVNGKAIGPPTLYETYDPRYRPWYIAAQDGKLWSEPYVFAEDEELGITAVRPILSETNQFLGVFAVDYDLSTIDSTLYDLISASGGDDTDYVVFVVESNGKMIASSIAGTSVDTSNGTPTQVSAVDCDVDVIAGVSQAVMSPQSEGGGGGWASANGTILIVEVEGKGRYWAQSQRVSNAYDLHWYVVVAEPVNCDVGYYVPPGNVLAGCEECPEGGVCLGGSYMPYPMPGYWVDRSSYVYGGKFYTCVFSTCKGYQEREKTLPCWTEFGFNHSRCHNNDYDFDGDDDDDPLICKEGSTGPLCGYCAKGYHYSSGSTICLSCENNSALLQLILFWTFVSITLLIVAIVLSIQYQKKHHAKHFENNSYLQSIDHAWLKMLRYPPFNLLKHIDRGMAKVVWVTAQILSTIPWNLSVTYPDPFTSLFVSKLQYFQLDFVPWKCFENSNNFLTKVYILSFTPIILAVLDFLVYILRCYAIGIKTTNIRLSEFGTSAGSKITSQHAYFALLLSYLVLPICSLVQFSALTCIKLQDGSSYLKADTSIDCNSPEYKAFVVIDICLIVAYQSVPLIWLYLLWKVKFKLNPELNVDEKAKTIQDRFLSTNTMIRRNRNEDYSIRYLSFLWEDYQPTKWWFEVFEMYRRTVFVAVIPLLGGDGQLRSIFGTLLSMIMVAFLSETSPFISKITNSMLIVAQYQILFTFFVAVIISADALSPLHTSNEVVGLMLVGVNILIIVIVIWCSSIRLLREIKEAKWRKAIDDKQLAILNQYMDNLDNTTTTTTPSSSSDGNPKGKRPFKRRSLESVLKRYILNPKEIKLMKKVGVGAFGEVFHGKCVGQPVAIKTMIDVTEYSVQSFRSEILMTAMLRHPNIVNFVGACWGRELICLVLEWVPNGTLSEFLANSSEGHLPWSQPLLRLSIDIARGMAFLQEFTYFDEVDGQDYKGIIHGDLSPNNCLVGDFATVKISDFGTAHANASHKMNLSASATPLFAAPELCRGNSYNEKVDVYSFGMILAYLAISGKLFDNIVDKWHSHFMTLNLAQQQAGGSVGGLEDSSSPGRLISTSSHSSSNKPSYLSNRFSNSSPTSLSTPLSNNNSNSSSGTFSSLSSSMSDSSIILNKVLKAINEEGWEVFEIEEGEDVLSFSHQCPPVVYELICKCCSQDPSKRPSFPSIMTYLLNKCEEELSNLHSVSVLNHHRKSNNDDIDEESFHDGYVVPTIASSSFNQKTNIDDDDDDEIKSLSHNEYRGSEVLRQSHQIRSSQTYQNRTPSISFKAEVEMAPSHI